MTAAHAGWGSEVVPVGGGGAVCERICDAWRDRDDVELTVLGTGPHAPVGVRYHQLTPPPGGVPPTRLSEFQYASLCRAFERACTEFVLDDAPGVVIAHDISEGPDFARLRAANIPVITLVHVDVVEYFVRMYMRRLIKPWHAAKFFRRVRPWPIVPDVLRLVFDKQEDCALHSSRMIVPSLSMRAVLSKCYPDMPDSVSVIGWGAQNVEHSAEAVTRERNALRQAWDVKADERIVMTLSRISPEKGQDRLLQAIQHAERAGDLNCRVVICGAPAFMQGASFMRRLQNLAARLRTPVIFAGHLEGARKRAALELADVFVSASRHESYGLTTMEAYAAGTPVVAIDSHGARATVDETCGRVVVEGPRLIQRLWLEIETMLRNDDFRNRLAKGAHQRARRERFSDAAERILAQIRIAAGVP